MKFFENTAGYIILALLIIGQCLVRISFVAGQVVYLLANVLAVLRVFALHRLPADKIKEISCLGITTGLLLISVL